LAEVKVNADPKRLGRLGEADYAIVAVSSSRDTQMLEHLAHADRCPGLAIAGLATHAVERHCDTSVTPTAGKLADRLDGAWRREHRSPVDLYFRHADLAVTAASPMDQQRHSARSTPSRRWRGGKSIEVFDAAADQPRTLVLFPEDRCEGLRPDASAVRLRLSEVRLSRPRQWGARWYCRPSCEFWRAKT
jgi:hypothetical protein